MNKVIWFRIHRKELIKVLKNYFSINNIMTISEVFQKELIVLFRPIKYIGMYSGSQLNETDMLRLSDLE
jgi:hypothetical protein